MHAWLTFIPTGRQFDAKLPPLVTNVSSGPHFRNLQNVGIGNKLDEIPPFGLERNETPPLPPIVMLPAVFLHLGVAMGYNFFKFPRWNLALILGGLAASVSISAARSDSLIVQGSTTFATSIAQPHASAVEALTGHNLAIIPNKSNLGLLALMERKADLAMISTTLEREIEILSKVDPSFPFQRLRAFEIARTRAALVIHPDNPIRSAQLADIGKILTGEISNWKQLGGPDLPIRIVAVREGGGVLASVEARLLGAAHISAPDVIRVQVGTQIVRVVAQERGAIGITQLAIVQSSSAVEMVTDERIEQILSLISLDVPSPPAMAIIEAFRRIADQGN